MAYPRSNTKSTAPSIVRRNTDHDDYSPPSSRNRHTSGSLRTNSDDLEELTNELVHDFKGVVQAKTRNGGQMSKADVEAAVANIRQRANPTECNINRWERDLPRELRNCPEPILKSSMAYGNDLREVQPIIEAKMNETSSDQNRTNKSLENIIGPLKELKKELDRNKSPNLFKSIRAIRDTHRANRLFFAEAYHFVPGLKDYTYAGAEKSVTAIRETDCETDRPDVLLPMIKTFDDVDEIREHLEKMSLKQRGPNRSSSRHSDVSDDDDRRPASPPIVNTAPPKKTNPNNDTSTFHYKPLDSPYSSTSPSASRSGRFAHLPNDEPTQSSPNTRTSRK